MKKLNLTVVTVLPAVTRYDEEVIRECEVIRFDCKFGNNHLSSRSLNLSSPPLCSALEEHRTHSSLESYRNSDYVEEVLSSLVFNDNIRHWKKSETLIRALKYAND